MAFAATAAARPLPTVQVRVAGRFDELARNMKVDPVKPGVIQVDAVNLKQLAFLKACFANEAAKSGNVIKLGDAVTVTQNGSMLELHIAKPAAIPVAQVGDVMIVPKDTLHALQLPRIFGEHPVEIDPVSASNTQIYTSRQITTDVAAELNLALPSAARSFNAGDTVRLVVTTLTGDVATAQVMVPGQVSVAAFRPQSPGPQEAPMDIRSDHTPAPGPDGGSAAIRGDSGSPSSVTVGAAVPMAVDHPAQPTGAPVYMMTGTLPGDHPDRHFHVSNLGTGTVITEPGTGHMVRTVRLSAEGARTVNEHFASHFHAGQTITLKHSGGLALFVPGNTVQVVPEAARPAAARPGHTEVHPMEGVVQDEVTMATALHDSRVATLRTLVCTNPHDPIVLPVVTEMGTVHVAHRSFHITDDSQVKVLAQYGVTAKTGDALAVPETGCILLESGALTALNPGRVVVVDTSNLDGRGRPTETPVTVIVPRDVEAPRPRGGAVPAAAAAAPAAPAATYEPTEHLEQLKAAVTSAKHSAGTLVPSAEGSVSFIPNAVGLAVLAALLPEGTPPIPAGATVLVTQADGQLQVAIVATPTGVAPASTDAVALSGLLATTNIDVVTASEHA